MVRVLLNDPAQEGRKVMNKLLLVLMSVVLVTGCSSSMTHYHNGIERFGVHSSRGIGTSSVVINTNDQKFQNYTAEIGLPNGEGEMLARQRIYADEQRRNNDVLYGGYNRFGYVYNHGLTPYNQGVSCHLPGHNRCYVYYDRATGAMSTVPPGWGTTVYTTLPPTR